MKNINNYFLSILFTLLSIGIGYGQCGSVNAGGSATTCGTEYTLAGSTEGDATGLMWSVVSVPTGATNPTISDPTVLNPLITGMNKPGYYKFRLTKTCAGGSTTFSEVTITSTGDTSTFSAGSDITDVFATVGTVNLNGVIPEGFTGEWKAENIYEWKRFARKNSNNATLSNPNIANPTFSLIKKADHDADPAYTLTLKITSVYNSNCSYVKTIIVRFIPNPQIQLSNIEVCANTVLDNMVYVSYVANSPRIGSEYPETTGHPSSGTTITLNVISEPIGGNLSLVKLETGNVHFKTNALGLYRYTISVSNLQENYTTPEYTINITGLSPSYLNFVDPMHPNQHNGYSYGGSAGMVVCGYEGKDTPIDVFFSINEKDDPLTTTTTASIHTGNYPPGGEAPILAITGDGQRKRILKVTPPLGGWRVGTYAISFSTQNGSCTIGNTYFIHVSDGNRPDLSIEDVVVCYPGSGIVDATVVLPPVYQEVINPNYLAGNYDGEYVFSVVSKPANSSTPIYENRSNRSIKSTSTIISNLDKPGEYVFKVKAQGYIPLVDWVLEEEYACSGASRETTFKIIVSEQVGSNAGSDQPDVFCRERIVLVGNDPGAGTGKWTVESAPLGTNISFSDDTSPRAVVAGLDKTGSYKFRWTITTGSCQSSSIVEVVTNQDNCKAPFLITNPMMPGKTKKRAK
ncbi:hypothetical protein [Myroides pelagicus]|nr:hypothetical protein [Myroides pelagicus]